MNEVSVFLSSPFQMFALFLSAVLLGMAKTGVQGIAMISIPLMAMAFGAKESTGVILPVWCFADLIAVIYYRQSAQWKYVFKLLPAAFVGLGIAIVVDKFIPHQAFKHLMAICIFVGLITMIWSEFRKNKSGEFLQQWWYSALFGIMGGFTTMIGNAAGGVMAVYLLSMRLNKLAFVGTNAWFFLAINYSKIPLQIFAWDNISLQTLLIDAMCIPFIFIGAVIGIWFVKRLPDKAYRIFVIASTTISTIFMLI